jgi:hypothetical protein
VSIHIQSAFVSVSISINGTSSCVADNVTDSWCCYVGNEEDLHVLLLCLTGFLLELCLRGT